jgi:demethylmenaquinone methyltransferase/2-methoxy-6-polyprenyl-1,4-benzoquinol methylase
MIGGMTPGNRREPDLPVGADKRTMVRAMFDRIAPRYDLLNRVMTFGMDISWRRTTVASLRLPPGSLVADVACGTGDFCRLLSEAGFRPIGLDFSWGMLARARTDAALVQADALALPLGTGSVYGATSGFALRNVLDLDVMFDELARVVRAGGRIALLEVAEPETSLLRAGHRIYFNHVVPRLGALLSDASAYSYLPRSVVYLPATARLVDMLRAAGFTDVTARRLFPGVVQVLSATRS